MKICRICNLEKALTDFYESGLRRSDFICKKCSVKVGRERRHRIARDNDMHNRYLYARSSAKNTKKAFTLSEEDYISIASRPCYYCGSDIRGLGIGLDRINNDKAIGYTKDNVLPCCVTCNKIRGTHLTVEETKVAMAAVLEFRKHQ